MILGGHRGTVWLLAVFLILAWMTTPAWAVRLNDKAPEFTLQDLNGKPVALSSFKGKVVYLNFWASWCGPCKKEFPELSKLAMRFQESNFVILAINQDIKRSSVDEFLDEHATLASNMIVLLDPKFSVITSYGPRSMPTSFIVDKEGMVRYVHFGFNDVSDPVKWPVEVEALLK